MKKHKKTIGVVLAEAAHGENGKRLTLFTGELGKVTAFANGAKKAKSPLLAATQLFVFGNYELYQGKDAYTLTGAEVIESFYGLRSELILTAYAACLSELSLSFLQDGITGEALLKLIYIAFEELLKKEISPAQIKAVFSMKLLVLAGYMPAIDDCVRCGRQEVSFFFPFRMVERYAPNAFVKLMTICRRRFAERSAIFWKGQRRKYFVFG